MFDLHLCFKSDPYECFCITHRSKIAMPPKKDAKKDDKKDEPAGDEAAAKLQQLEKAKQDMELEQAIMDDKLKQLKAENERLLADVDHYKSRLTQATKDYADVLEHREEQIRQSEQRVASLQQQVDRLQAEIAKNVEEINRLKSDTATQSSKLTEVEEMLADKDNLESSVKKQHDLLERQAQELKIAKVQLAEKDGALNKAKDQIEELTLKASGTTALKVLFDEPWLVQKSHYRLKGSIPSDREGQTLSCLAGGKAVVLYGGMSRGHEDIGREVSILNTDTMQWDKPSSASVSQRLTNHTATVVSRTKILVHGGAKGESTTTDVAVFNIDTLKWVQPQIKGIHSPPARWGHASASIRDRVLIFGGANAQGELLQDLWILDQDSLQWTHASCIGHPPSARKGATLCATEDGRRMYVFGGYDGYKALNDVHCLDVEKLVWSAVSPLGHHPEPREGHSATIIGKYLVVSGGCGAANEYLTDTHVLDLFTGPTWECLDEGAWGNNMLWLKQHSVYTTFHGTKLLTIKPNLHEQLDELQVVELSLPEDIQRMRAGRRKDTETVDQLEICDDAVCGSNSIDVSWRPPSKNSERIERFKLMLATSTGVVKEVCQGKHHTWKVQGLKPNVEYVFCVKAVYDDGSFLWSESKAFRTKQ